LEPEDKKQARKDFNAPRRTRRTASTVDVPVTAGTPGGNGSWAKKRLRQIKAAKDAAAASAHILNQKEDNTSTTDIAIKPMDMTSKGKVERQKKFLWGLVESGTIAAGCRVADVTRTTYYQWLQEGGDFKVAVEAAFEEVADGLEEQGLARAKEKSDILLIFLLKGYRPKFRDNFKGAEESTKPEEEAEKKRLASNVVRERLGSLRKRRGVTLESDVPKLAKVEDLEEQISRARSGRKIDKEDDEEDV
jgi:hypothetical protein